MTIKLVAEIGCNHKGDINIAKELIRIAAQCGADVAKFQKRNNKELLTTEQYNSPHPNPIHSYGNTYGEHREFLEFTKKQHQELVDYCNEIGILYSTSVWDLSSAKEIAELNPDIIKIPSATNNHFEMLEWLCDNYQGELHVSTGMTNYKDIDEIVNLFISKNRNKDLVLYNCTSGYPVPYQDICLLEITRLKEKYGELVKEIGFSGHHLGVAVDIAAFALGAKWIERHFTMDQTWKGTDHSASLEPADLKLLANDLKSVAAALKYKEEEILDIEKVQYEKLKFRR